MELTMRNKLAALLLLSGLIFTSCLRDADTHPPAKTESSKETETVIENVTEERTEESSMEEYPMPEPEISDAAQVWIDAKQDTTEVIMTLGEITSENERVMKDSDVMTDILALPESITSDEIKAFIDKGHVPSLPKYDSDGSEITLEHLQNVVSSMGTEIIPESISPRMAIVTARANLRAFPDDKPYRKSPSDPYDTIQQTELHVGTPVWVVYESTCGEYLLVRSSNYAGWVKAENIAVTDSADEFNRFAVPENFVCITATSVKLEETELDMGVILPLASEDREGFTVKLPVRLSDGTLGDTETRLTRDVANKGYLDFTYENFIIQAFKYEGTMYSWGGLDTGVDCSSFVGNVLRTFGFRLPRDTKDQQKIVGTSIEVRGKSSSEISMILESTNGPTAVYYPGHVLFYLGHGTDGKYYFIHAPQIGEAVSVTAKTSLENMTYICEFSAKEGVSEVEPA